MKVRFYTKKLQKLVGLLDLPKNKTDKIIICMHGMMGSKENSRTISWVTPYFVKAGYAVLRFDFNSHGESYNDWKDFTRCGLVNDYRAALELAKKKGFKHIGVYTTSMGADPFIMYPQVSCAVLHDLYILKKMWVDWIKDFVEENKARGYIKIYSVELKKWMKFGLSLQEESLNIDFSKYVKNVKCPTSVISGNDEVMKKYGRSMYRLFKCKKGYKEIPNMHHYMITRKHAKQIASYALEWFDKYLQ